MADVAAHLNLSMRAGTPALRAWTKTYALRNDMIAINEPWKRDCLHSLCAVAHSNNDQKRHLQRADSIASSQGRIRQKAPHQISAQQCSAP